MKAQSEQNNIELDINSPYAIHQIYKEHGPCCVTIILSARKSNRKYIRAALKSALTTATDAVLGTDCEPASRDAVLEHLRQIGDESPSPSGEGLGWYVSPSIASFFRFPFPVTDRVLVDEGFRLSELATLISVERPFVVLSLSSQSARLYRFEYPFFEEIVDGSFPLFIDNDYEYARPSRGTSFGSSLKGFEREKTDVLSIRTNTMLRHVDDRLYTYVESNSCDVVLAGPERLVHHYQRTSVLASRILATVYGNYSEGRIQLLQIKAREAFAHAIQSRNERFADHVASQGRRPIQGLDDCWKALFEGKGMRVFLNSDHCEKAYLSESSSQLFLRAPDAPHRVIFDIISEMIRLAYRKNTRVVMLPERIMRRFDHALVQPRF